MNMKKMMMALAAGSLAITAQALTLSVKDVKIAQRYPWNGLVDIDYTVVCDEPATNIWVYPVGYDADFNVSVAPRTLEGDGVNGAPVTVGAEGEKTFRMTWNMAADMPANYNRAKFSMKIHAYAGAAPYMVINLSPGPNADKYEVTYLTEIPNGSWSDLYKTTNMVLKLVRPGTFMMGSPADELGRSDYEVLHKVTITHPFYMGVFEVTQNQYELVTGRAPSKLKGYMRPVESVTYNDLRGAVLGANWPEHIQVDAESFFGKIRARTGITFDLPTEAEWEYTCRAGTGTALNSGRNLSAINECYNMAEVGRYGGNKNDGKGGYTYGHTVVAMYKPNVWGFYDMHGNVAEWCRDWWQNRLTDQAVDPKGAESGTYRIIRGGNCQFRGSNAYTTFAALCRSAARGYDFYDWDGSNNYYLKTYPSTVYAFWGFRVAAYPAE